MKCIQSFLVGYVECHASTVCVDIIPIVAIVIKTIKVIVLVVVFILVHSGGLIHKCLMYTNG